MAFNVNFGTFLGNIGQAQSKSAFEVQFQSIQRTIFQRANKEIAKATDDGTPKKLTELQKKHDEIKKHADQAEKYLFGLQTNKSRFSEIASAASDIVNTYDSKTSLTTAEATALNDAKQAVIDNIQKLQLLQYPNFSDGGVTSRLQQYVSTLQNLTATAGTVDASGTSPSTNDNRTLIDTLSTVSDSAVNFADSTGIVIENVNQFLIDAQSQTFSLEAQATELTKVQLEQNSQKADQIKLKYANLLKAISLSFDSSASLADALNTGTQPLPAKGSVLNLFT